MLQIKKSIAAVLHGEVLAACPDAALDQDSLATWLEYPPDVNMGDLAFPCFKLSKIMRRSPVQIASLLAEKVVALCDCVESAENVNGYLNMRIKGADLIGRVLPEILSKGEKYGAPNFGEGKTVVLDYSSPNLAKPFHVGHLGTTVIGHALKKLHEFAGYKCVGINYVGDWGTQFGKLIVAYKKWGDRKTVEEGGVDALVDLYVKINNAISGNEEMGITADPALAAEARAEFLKMEQGDEENLALWKWLVQMSLNANEETYKQLGITFDSYKGESFYTDKMPAQIEKLRAQNLLTISDGASIVDLSDYKMPPCLILKSDGASLYPARDIAAAVERKETYNYDKMIYVTAAQQSLHFAQWFKVVELMGYDWYDQLVHVPYGMVSINGAKLATRTGNVVLLRDLFAAAIEKVRQIMDEKNPDLPNKDEAAEAVGVGAIVFYYLSNNRIKDINFNMEDALSYDGNTGPYVQYTYARTCSVMNKAAAAGCTTDADFAAYTLCAQESELLKTLSRFGECVLGAIRDLEPSEITRYILDVAAAFNRFYHDCSILSAEDETTRAFRVALTAATRTVLGNAFELICLRKIEQI